LHVVIQSLNFGGRQIEFFPVLVLGDKKANRKKVTYNYLSKTIFIKSQP
jgi:hypothetical protein